MNHTLRSQVRIKEMITNQPTDIHVNKYLFKFMHAFSNTLDLKIKKKNFFFSHQKGDA